MKRRLFAILSAVSLLLAVATVGLWVRSCWFNDGVLFGRIGCDSHVLTSALGEVRLKTEMGRGQSVVAFRSLPLQSPNPGAPKGSIFYLDPSWHGFAWSYNQSYILTIPARIKTIDYRVIAAPHWFLATMFSISPALWLWRRVVLRRRIIGANGNNPRIASHHPPMIG